MIRNPNPPQEFFSEDEMLLTLESDSPYTFWSKVVAFESFDNVRPHFGILIPSGIGPYGNQLFGWSYSEDNYWSIEEAHIPVSLNGSALDCEKLLKDTQG